MSDIDTLIDGLDDNQAYYDPNQSSSPKKPIEPGTYEATVQSLSIKRDITVKGKYLSDIFEATYFIDDSNHAALKNRQVKSKGYFRFKMPDATKYPNLEDNAGQNKGYMIFCEACGFDIPKNDEGKYVLPMISEGDIAGNPVTIKIENDKWVNREGEDMLTPVAINVFKSQRVVEKPMTKDELPF